MSQFTLSEQGFADENFVERGSVKQGLVIQGLIEQSLVKQNSVNQGLHRNDAHSDPVLLPPRRPLAFAAATGARLAVPSLSRPACPAERSSDPALSRSRRRHVFDPLLCAPEQRLQRPDHKPQNQDHKH